MKADPRYETAFVSRARLMQLEETERQAKELREELAQERREHASRYHKLAFAYDELDQEAHTLRMRNAAARSLHERDPGDPSWCSVCESEYDYPWPCRTAKTLGVTS